MSTTLPQDASEHVGMDNIGSNEDEVIVPNQRDLHRYQDLYLSFRVLTT